MALKLLKSISINIHYKIHPRRIFFNLITVVQFQKWSSVYADHGNDIKYIYMYMTGAQQQHACTVSLKGVIRNGSLLESCIIPEYYSLRLIIAKACTPPTAPIAARTLLLGLCKQTRCYIITSLYPLWNRARKGWGEGGGVKKYKLTKIGTLLAAAHTAVLRR